MADAPLFSVVIPAYNSAKYLPRAVASVLNQTLTDLELLVVDDGSEDDTPELMAGYVARDRERVRYVRQDNAGASAARNAGIRLARGTWLAFLDSDDWWEPGKLARQHEVALQDPAIRVIFSDVQLLVNSVLCPNKVTAGVPTTADPDWIFELIVKEVCFPTGAVVRSDDLRAVDGFRTAFHCGEDIDLWLRLFPGRRMMFLSEPLGVHVVRQDSLSRSSGFRLASESLIGAYKAFLNEQRDVHERFRARARAAIAQYYFDWGWMTLVNNQEAAARQLFVRSIRYRPVQLAAAKELLLSYLPRSLRRLRGFSR